MWRVIFAPDQPPWHTHSVWLLRTRNQPVAIHLPDNTQHSHGTDIRVPWGIWTSNPIKWAAALTPQTAWQPRSDLVENIRSKYLFMLFPVLCTINKGFTPAFYFGFRFCQYLRKCRKDSVKKKILLKSHLVLLIRQDQRCTCNTDGSFL